MGSLHSGPPCRAGVQQACSWRFGRRAKATPSLLGNAGEGGGGDLEWWTRVEQGWAALRPARCGGRGGRGGSVWAGDGRGRATQAGICQWYQGRARWHQRVGGRVRCCGAPGGFLEGTGPRSPSPLALPLFISPQPASLSPARQAGLANRRGRSLSSAEDAL